MPIRAASGTLPRWDDLHEVALGQAGYFTTQQAAEHHIGTALLAHHLKARRIERAIRGVFRFRPFPAREGDDLVPLWLWSGREGVFSHQTALAFYNLSDLSPIHVDLTVPVPWQKRRLRVPEGVFLHCNDLRKPDRASGPVPFTSVPRTLNDCADAELEKQFLRQAIHEALARGLLKRSEISSLRPALQAFATSFLRLKNP